MSFLDERDNRPRRPPAPRPPGGGRRPPRRPYGPGTDQRTLLIRRAVAVTLGLIGIIAVILLIRGCLNARAERDYEDYAQEVTSLVSESSQESEALFEILEDPGAVGGAVDVQNTLNGLSVDAQRLVERAEGADPPGALAGTQDSLMLTLELRQESLEGIARELPTALGDEQRDEAIDAIAEALRGFLASDVIYAERTAPSLDEALRAEGLAPAGSDLPESEFLPDIAWLEPETVRDAISQIDAAEETE